MAFSPSAISTSLTAILLRHGLRADTDRSGLSSSQYITVDRYDDEAEDFTGPELKVRSARAWGL